MITPTAIPGFTYTKQSYATLLAGMLDIPGWTPEYLGESTGGHDMYGFSYGDTETKPVMFVEGNIHGLHEWRTCYWVSGFMQHLHDPSTLATDTEAAIEDLKARYSFYFIPACNPDGYVSNIYQNGNGVNLNRNFDYNWSWGPSTPGHVQYRGPAPFSEVETQYIRDKVEQLRPVSFMDNHTWSSTREGFTTLATRESAQAVLVSEFHENVMRAVDMWPDGDAPRTSNPGQGLAGNWGAVTESSLGGTPISITFESGGGWTEQQQAHVGMTAILYHLLSVDAHLAPPSTEGVLMADSWGPLHLNGADQTVTRVDTVVNGALSPVWAAP